MNNLINIGKPSFDKRKIPVLIDKGIFINEKVKIRDNNYIISCITIDKPYVIVLNKDIDDIGIDKMFYDIQSFYIFPEKINIIFSNYKDNLIINKVYEKDINSNYSSACASVVAQTLYQNLIKEQEIIVNEYNNIYSVIYKENGDLLVIEKNKDKILKK